MKTAKPLRAGYQAPYRESLAWSVLGADTGTSSRGSPCERHNRQPTRLLSSGVSNYALNEAEFAALSRSVTATYGEATYFLSPWELPEGFPRYWEGS